MCNMNCLSKLVLNKCMDNGNTMATTGNYGKIRSFEASTVFPNTCVCNVHKQMASAWLSNRDLEKFTVFLKSRDIDGIEFRDNFVEGKYVTFDCNRNKVFRIDRAMVQQRREKFRTLYDFEFIRKFGELVVLFFGNGSKLSFDFKPRCKATQRKMKSEGLFDLMWKIPNMISSWGQTTSEKVSKGFDTLLNEGLHAMQNAGGIARDAFSSSLLIAIDLIITTISKIVSVDLVRTIAIWIADFMAFFMDMSRVFYAGSFISLLIRFVTLCSRLVYDIFPVSKRRYVSESAELIALLLAAEAPTSLIDIARKISVFTDPKLLTSKGPVFRLISYMFRLCTKLLEWLGQRFPFFLELKTLVETHLSFVKFYEYEEKLRDIIIAYHKNGNVINNVDYRKLVLDTYREMRESEVLADMVTSECNITSLKPYFEQFKGIYVSCLNYAKTGRMEPVCIVLEGGAGTGKSRLMGKFIQFLQSKNYSTYNHTVPPVDAGKDFWDQYQNQDVTVFDDMGQQGVSQWRSIINLVAPIAYPLDCAKAELKGTKHFVSDLIMVTTNHFSDLTGFTKADCISEPAALHRRGLCVTVTRPTNEEDQGKKCTVEFKRFDYVNNVWVHSLDPECDSGEGEFPTRIEDITYDQAVPWLYCLSQLYLVKNRKQYKANDLSGKKVELEKNCDQFMAHYNLTIPDYKSESSFVFDCVKTILDEVSRKTVEIVTDFSTRVINYISNCAKEIEAYRDDLICIALVLFATFGMYGGFKWLFKTTPAPIHPKMIKRLESCFKVSGHQLDFESESQSQSFAENHIRFAKAFSTKMFQTETSSNYIIVSGKRAILPLHMYRHNMKMDVAKSQKHMNENVVELNMVPVTLVEQFDHLDLCVIEFSINHIIYKDGVDRMFPVNSLTSFSMCKFINSDFEEDLPFSNLCINPEDFRTNKAKFKKESGFFYAGLTKEGLCGSVLFAQENGIVGIHLAGNGETGFSIVPSKRDRAVLATALRSGDCKYTIIDISKDMTSNVSGLRFMQNDLKAQHPLDKTSLIPTELHGEFEDIPHVKRAPPNFKSMGSARQTLKAMSAKNFKRIPYIKEDEEAFVEACVSEFMTEFADITEKEVVNGKPGLSRVNPDSVNGYGYEGTKHDHIDYENGTIGPIPKAKIEELKRQSESGTIDPELLLTYDCFKDELRIPSKVNKPRVFRILPLHHSLFLKECLGDLMVYIKNNMWFNQIAIGLNPYKDWDQLYKSFSQKYKYFCDGDIGNYDGGAAAIIQRVINRVVLKFYKGKHSKALKVVLESIVTSLVLTGGALLYTTHSMPSGCLVTALFNSLINRGYTALTYYRQCMKQGRKPTVKEFLTIGDFVMGDDKLMGVTEDLKDIINAFTLKETFNSLGMEFTDAKKGEITEPFKPLQDCQFLKRGFAVHPKLGKIVGPLSFDTIIGSLEWSDSRKDKDIVMAGKSIAFQYELFLHKLSDMITIETEDGRLCSFNVNDLEYRVQSLYALYGYNYEKLGDERIMKSMLEDDDLYIRLMVAKGKNFFN